MNNIKDLEKSLNSILDQFDRVGMELFGMRQSDGLGWDSKQIRHVFKALGDVLPLKEGDRAYLRVTPNLPDVWKGYGHFLKRGSEGVVHSISMHDGIVKAHIMFDDETWIDSNGVHHPVRIKHTWGYTLDMLRKVEE